MVDSYLSKHCTPLQALQLVQHEVGRGVEVARLIRFAVDPGSIVNYIKVWVPEEGAPAAGPSVAQPPDDALDLEWGLPKVLACAKGGRGDLAEPDNDVLFIRADVSRDQFVETVRTLERAASPCFAACVAGESGPLYLLHVLDEYRRLSGLGGLKALGILDGWQELQCYSYERVRLFLPESIHPEQEFLQAYCALLEQEPVTTLLHLTPQGRRQELYYILKCSLDSPSDYEVLPLPESAFVDTGEVGLPVAATVRVLPLASKQAPTPLADLLEREAPNAGYRLQLRPSKFRADLEMEHEKLRLRRAEMDQRLAHLESVRQQRPYLLRFGAHQIRALAEVIYSYPASALSESECEIQYAFQANRHSPAGCHYLLVGPGAVRHQMDPLLLHDNDPAMRFWLDPSWARYYPDEGNVCYVFVPEHTALFPSLHTWHTEDMDRHLRDVLSQRWVRESGAREFPEVPYYIFDWTPDGESLELSVLGEADFAPPRTRLQWISDHLTVAGKVPIETHVTNAAVAIAWERIAEEARQSARQAEAAFEAEAQATRARLAHDLKEMVLSVKVDTEEVVRQVSQLARQIDDLDQRRKVLIDVRDRKHATVRQFEELMKFVGGDAKTFADKLALMEKQIEFSLQRAASIAVEERQRVEALVQQLEAERGRLQRELDGWMGGGR